MGDFKNMLRDLRETRRLQRGVSWKSLALEIVSWIGVVVALYMVLRFI